MVGSSERPVTGFVNSAGPCVLRGVDVDPATVDLLRITSPDIEVVHADALGRTWPIEGTTTS